MGGEIDPGAGACLMFFLLAMLLAIMLYAGTHGRGK